MEDYSKPDAYNVSVNSTINDTVTPLPTPVSCRTQVAFGKEYQEFEYIINLYVTTGLIIFGLLGNIVSFVTLKYMKQATVVFLLRALAAVDSLYLLTCLSLHTFRTLYIYSDTFSDKFWFYPYISVVTWPIASMTQTASVWMVVLVTFDRYEAICHAIAMNKYMTKTKVKFYVGIVLLGSVCFNLPTAFDLKVVDRRSYCPKINKVDTYVTAFFQDPLYEVVYKTVLSIIFRAALPVLIVVILNLWMLCQIRQSERYRSDMVKGVSSGIRSINIMIGIITMVYLFCEVPDLTYRILRAVKFYRPKFLMPWSQFAYFAQISNLLLTINSSTNFLWYCIAGSKFRETLKWRFCLALSSDNVSSTMMTLSTRYTTSSTPTSPGTPLFVAKPGRPLSLPGTPLLRAGGSTLFPIAASLAKQRTLSDYIRPGNSKIETILSSSAPVTPASTYAALISKSPRSRDSLAVKFV